MINLRKRYKRLKRYIKDNLPMDRLSRKAKLCLTTATIIMSSFFVIESLIVFKILKPSYESALFGYFCIIFFTFPLLSFVKEFLDEVSSKERKLIEALITKNTYLEHATKILRHDMHSGINTYIPRGIRSLERRLNDEIIKDLKIEAPLTLIKEGLAHAQQVYRGVYEFTNLIRPESTLQILPVDLKKALNRYLRRTSYKDQVVILDLPTLYVNEALMCTAIDNLIRNGLKYNDSKTKWVKIKMANDSTIAIMDNGRGMSQQEFDRLRKPYIRKSNQAESGSGLGLNITVAILEEHDFKISVQKLEKGTMILIDINSDISLYHGDPA